MLKDLDIAPDDPAELRAVNRLLADEVKALTLKVEQLQHQLAVRECPLLCVSVICSML